MPTMSFVTFDSMPLLTELDSAEDGFCHESEVFSRPVDLVSRRAVEGSKNPYRKQAILSTAIPIYVEG